MRTAALLIALGLTAVPALAQEDFTSWRLHVERFESTGGGEMDHSLEALIGLVGAHGNTLELLELAEEVLDQMAPFVHFGVDLERGGTARMLRDHDLGAALVEVGNDLVAVKGRVGDQGAELKAIDQRRDPDSVEALSGQQHKADEIAESVGEGQDFCRHAAFGAANGLARSPPFAPCPWRWTLTMVASTMAYSMSGSFLTM